MVEVQFHIKTSPCGTNFTWSKLSFISKTLLVEQITWVTLEEFRCWYYQPYKRQPHKMVKHTQTIRRQNPTNCLSVSDHFLPLALKGLKINLILDLVLI